MSEFVFLYRGGSQDGSPAEMQQVMQKWMNWLKGLGEKGHIKIKANLWIAPVSW
jgi:hypothetical protein